MIIIKIKNQNNNYNKYNNNSEAINYDK